VLVERAALEHTNKNSATADLGGDLFGKCSGLSNDLESIA
jgi:hypothetical protein